MGILTLLSINMRRVLYGVLILAAIWFLWHLSDRLMDRFGFVGGVAEQVDEMEGAGPIVEGPGSDPVAFRDSTGEVTIESPEDLDFDAELAIEVEREEEENLRLVAGVRTVWFPDITGQSSVQIRSLSGDPHAVRTTAQRAALLSLTSQFSVGVSGTQIDGTLRPGVMLAFSPVQVWAVRLGVFGTVSTDKDKKIGLPVTVGGGPALSLRLTRTVRPFVGYDLLHNSPAVGLLIDL